MNRPTPAERLQVAVVGAGVIGSGWVARLALAGHDVRWHDPDPGVAGTVRRTLENAESAWGQLRWQASRSVPEPMSTLDAAVAGADLIVESVPERLHLKRAVYAAVEESCGPGAIIASSTSGFPASSLAAELQYPDRLIVAHPFNPVYLLPLVELAPGPRTARGVVERCRRVFGDAGMKPLVIRKEIDAFIADRLLEAAWREALWLVNDGVATTEEIDDAIRFGFGLRFAQMGLFETYRIAGGEGGMRHFIAQFGEALHWPWTKLTAVPELTEELIDRIAVQSDAQSGHLTVAELERERDENLVAILNALADRRWGAGAIVADRRA